jgi:hypothetical protein
MKRYKYYFNGLEDKPISIEATNKESARRKLEEICNDARYKENGYAIPNVVRETTETLVDGVSEKNINGVEFIWSKNGWIKNITKSY